jgi:hypothetical protein
MRASISAFNFASCSDVVIFAFLFLVLDLASDLLLLDLEKEEDYDASESTGPKSNASSALGLPKKSSAVISDLADFFD